MTTGLSGCRDCTSLVVPAPPDNVERGGPIDAFETLDALLSAVESGAMTALRGDCPITDMKALILAETKYTVVQFLHCSHCESTVFFGLCVRGWPIYRIVPAADVDTWPWEPSATAPSNALPTRSPRGRSSIRGSLLTRRADGIIGLIGAALMLLAAPALSVLAVGFGFVTAPCRWLTCDVGLIAVVHTIAVLAPPVIAVAGGIAMILRYRHGRRIAWLPFVLIPLQAGVWTLCFWILRTAVSEATSRG
ncbi:hypothetical protein [Rathayibacter tritici]|uniref:Uncharacterized protein n=1 Tax=Rathayibacter tritici TaxID=33888 RepID=A0A160KP97_9MICO|nr:hypothetical protein [Rathayibacter tritici]AND15250.1 hypothetical protein A6122_0081 [Rathayibacter tritici]PPI40994.1 hypothetical protein C5D18_15040 [Rathayibacter tritici]